MDKEFAEAFKEEIELDEMSNRKNVEKINSLLKDYHGKFKWRDEVLYVTKEIEKDVRSIIRKIGAATLYMVKVSSNPMREEIELDEMKWEVGVVYHQEFKNGDKVYFRADSVQKNKRWKGLSVDEFGGRQKKAKSASADEKQQGWVTTPKNEIPKGLKEEVEIDEASRTDTKRSGKQVANRMKSIRSMKPFASKVAKMKTVSVIDLERMLPADKVSTSDIDKVMQDWGWPKGEEVEEARKAAKDIGLECQECGKRFRSANPRYGVTKCPKCKSTDLDLAYGEEVEEAHKIECPKCKGEGCEHCDGKGYHIKEEVEIDESYSQYGTGAVGSRRGTDYDQPSPTEPKWTPKKASRAEIKKFQKAFLQRLLDEPKWKDYGPREKYYWDKRR